MSTVRQELIKTWSGAVVYSPVRSGAVISQSDKHKEVARRPTVGRLARGLDVRLSDV